LFGKCKEFIFGKEITVDQLVGLATTALEVPVVLVAASRWVDAGKIHIFVALHFVQNLVHQLSVLGTYPRKPVKKVLVHISLSQKIAEAILVNFLIFVGALGFLLFEMRLDHLQVSSHPIIVAQVLPQLVKAPIFLGSGPLLVIFLETYHIQGVHKQI